MAPRNNSPSSAPPSRFKPLDRLFPFVLITAPIDHRLVTDTHPRTSSTVRAKVLSDAPIAHVDAQLDDGEWTPMTPVERTPSLWQTPWQTTCRKGRRIAVRARDAGQRVDTDHVEPPAADWTPPARAADGSDADRVGAWPEKGILDTQLGPNRNGRRW